MTLTGTNFGTATGEISVSVDGIAGTVTACDDTSITFNTGVQASYVPTTLSITRTGKGYFNTKGTYFIYAFLWSEESTWGGETPPSDGQSVSIPAG